MNGPSPPRVESVVMNAPVVLQHEYLEAVTNAYMTSGILVTESKGSYCMLVSCSRF